MDGVATRDRKPSSLTGIMGRQTCHHVEQDTEILEQLLEVHFEGLNQPVEPPKVDPSKFCDDICGWLPDPNVQFRRPEKLKNNSTVRPISCRKPRQVSNRENFQFIHHSDSKRYIEQYRRLHTCGGPLEKLTQDTQGKDTSIYYTPLDQHRETNGNTNSYKHSHKTHTPTVNRAPLNYVATPRDIAPFDCLVKPSVTQYKPMYNIQSSSPHEADTGTGNNNNNNSDSGTSRSSSSETSCKCAYINSNGMVFSLPKPRLYVAPKSPSGINVSAPPGGLGRSPHRQSPPNGFSFDRNIGKLTSTVGRTLTEKLLENAENSRGSSKDMTATGYNIMTVDKKTDILCDLRMEDTPRLTQTPLPVAVGVKVQQTPRAQSAHVCRRPQTSVSATSKKTVRDKPWSAGAVHYNRDVASRGPRTPRVKGQAWNSHVPSICEGTFIDHLEKFTHQQCAMRLYTDEHADLRPPSRCTPVPLMRPGSLRKVIPPSMESLTRSQELEILRVAQGRSRPLRLDDQPAYEMWAADRQKTEQRARDRQLQTKGTVYKQVLAPKVNGPSRVFCAKGGGWKTYTNRHAGSKHFCSTLPPEMWQATSEHLTVSELFREEVRMRWEESLKQMNPHHKVRRKRRKSGKEYAEYEWDP